jgi:hypothetical protein
MQFEDSAAVYAGQNHLRVVVVPQVNIGLDASEREGDVVNDLVDELVEVKNGTFTPLASGLGWVRVPLEDYRTVVARLGRPAVRVWRVRLPGGACLSASRRFPSGG